jgi:multidrug efflux pump subunit AcrA (membrane-fusion protein)
MQLYVDARAITVPAPAVMTGQQGTFVYSVDQTDNAKQLPVVVARTVDSVAVIQSGLSVGQRVIVDGQSRLIPGSKVRIKPAKP